MHDYGTMSMRLKNVGRTEKASSLNKDGFQGLFGERTGRVSSHYPLVVLD